MTSMIRAAGMLIALLAIAPAIAQCSHHEQAAAQAPAAAHGDTQRIVISVTSEGFVPATTRVEAGKPVTLVVTRKIERTCATEIVVKDFGIRKSLPVGQPVEVTFTPAKPGTIRFACGMDMIAGQVIVD